MENDNNGGNSFMKECTSEKKLLTTDAQILLGKTVALVTFFSERVEVKIVEVFLESFWASTAKRIFSRIYYSDTVHQL